MKFQFIGFVNPNEYTNRHCSEHLGIQIGFIKLLGVLFFMLWREEMFYLFTNKYPLPSGLMSQICPNKGNLFPFLCRWSTLSPANWWEYTVYLVLKLCDLYVTSPQRRDLVTKHLSRMKMCLICFFFCWLAIYKLRKLLGESLRLRFHSSGFDCRLQQKLQILEIIWRSFGGRGCALRHSAPTSW